MEVGKLAVGNRRGERAYKLGRWIDGDRKGPMPDLFTNRNRGEMSQVRFGYIDLSICRKKLGY